MRKYGILLTKDKFPFRNDGIVIAITFWQWLVEFIFNLFVIGLIKGAGANRQVDHFMAIFSFWFGTSVIPAFYIMACAEFRRNLETVGLVKAFWLAFTNSWNTGSIELDRGRKTRAEN
jgi:hypothetical protein